MFPQVVIFSLFMLVRSRHRFNVYQNRDELTGDGEPCSYKCKFGDCDDQHCRCREGYAGEFCDIPWSCSDVPTTFCNSRGSCQHLDEKNICNCVKSYFGIHCEEQLLGASYHISESQIIVDYSFPSKHIQFDPSPGDNESDLVVIECGTIVHADKLLGSNAVCYFVVIYSEDDPGVESDVDSLVIELGEGHQFDEVEYMSIQLRTNDEAIRVKIEKVEDDNVRYYTVLVVVAIACFVFAVVCVVNVIYVTLVCLNREIKSNRRQKRLYKYLHGDDELAEPLLNEEEEFKVTKNFTRIKAKEIRLQQVVGQGVRSGAMIFRSTWKKKIVCTKVYPVGMSNDPQETAEFNREVGILGSVSHPNILVFYGLLMDPPRVGFVTEFCFKGNLRQFFVMRKIQKLKRNRVSRYQIGMREKLRMMTELTSALDYLAVRRIVHRDLKLDNCLVTDDLTLKLSDFGSATVLEEDVRPQPHVGTAAYMAPEVTLGEMYNEKADIFSLAIIMYEVFTENFNPYISLMYLSGRKSESVELRVCKDPNFRPRFDNLFREEFPSLVTVIEQCWVPDPNLRPSAIIVNQYLVTERERGILS